MTTTRAQLFLDMICLLFKISPETGQPLPWAFVRHRRVLAADCRPLPRKVTPWYPSGPRKP